MTSNAPLRALGLVCTLKPSPAPSSSSVILEQLFEPMRAQGVECETVRMVDHAVAPGVEADMGDGDQWPEIRRRILAADILVLGTPTWVGHMSSIAQRVLERLDAELSETDAEGRPILFGRVAAAVVLGNEDGAHKITADIFQALNDVGFTLPAQSGTYWNGEAMNTVDYKDLEDTPEPTAQATATLARNCAHLARALAADPYPAP
jgi:multimeric flavodoxin WrbA